MGLGVVPVNIHGIGRHAVPRLAPLSGLHETCWSDMGVNIDGPHGCSLTLDSGLRGINSSISTSASFADGGNISIVTGGDVYLTDTDITTAVGTGFGQGGNISITGPEFMILNRSNILANAFGGPGGNIFLSPDQFIASADSSVNASSELSNDGNIQITSPDVDLSSSLASLPSNYFNPAALLNQACETRRSLEQSKFSVANDSFVPVDVDDIWLSSVLDATGNESSKAGTIAYLVDPDLCSRYQ